MAKPIDNNEQNFDLDRFRKLLQLMEKFDVTEANLTKDGESWKVRRGPKHAPYAPPPVSYTPAAPQPVAAVVPAAEPAAAPAAPKGITIDAPTVGTFYSSPTPEEPVFVSVGDLVKADTTVCIIEAMKVFNQIEAEKAGRIVEVLVENGDPVEFGQPLFRIEPA